MGEERLTDWAKPLETKQIAADYLRELTELLQLVDLEAVERIVEHLRRVRDADGTVYVAGNGGSAATASHWANDLGKATKGLEPRVHAGDVPVGQRALADRARQRRGLRARLLRSARELRRSR